VNVDVKDRLARGLAVVHYEAVAIVVKSENSCDLGCADDQCADGRRVRHCEIVQHRDVLAWNHEKVRRCLRIDVFEGDYVVIFMNLARRDFTRDDAAEEAFVRGAGHLLIVSVVFSFQPSAFSFQPERDNAEVKFPGRLALADG